jgi:multicomponent Na+:H+ antiporter subunit A
VAVAVGTVIAALVLAATAGPFDPVLTQYFAERAVPDAHGRNVVNVVLVDFRAVDTLGEIAVVGASFIATIPLLLLVRARLAKSRRKNP